MKLIGTQPPNPHQSARSQARRFSVATLCAVLLAGGLSACGSSVISGNNEATPSSSGAGLGEAAKLVPESLKNQTLKVVVLEDYPPLGYKEGGQLLGTSPDLVKAIAEDTGLNIQIETASFDTMIPGMQSKRWAFAAPTFNVTDERRKAMDFVTVQSSYTTVVQLADSGFNLQEDTDVCGKRVAVLQGGVEGDVMAALSKKCVENGKPEVPTDTFASANQAVLALSSSRVDLIATQDVQIGAIVDQGNGKFEAKPEIRLFEQRAGIGFTKGSELGPIVLQAMKDLIANGKYHEIFSKYKIETSEIKDPELLK